MRLISCHIENYGALKNLDYEFCPGLNEIYAENGYGKTTMASFIRAMFYGLPKVTEKTKDFNDRRHFYPFAGGKFGGSICIEHNGKRWRIERFFDKKSPSKDELTLYIDNIKTEVADDADIGMQIFGIDEESFSRTAFINANDLSIASTGCINAQISGYTNDTAEGVSFENAIKALDKKRKELKADKGRNDLISKQKEKINKLQQEIGRLTQMDALLQQLYIERSAVESELKKLSSKKDALMTDRTLLQNWDTYDRYLSKIAEDKKQIEAITSRYPAGVPDREDIELLQRYYNEIDKLNIHLDALHADLGCVQKSFEEYGPPSEEDLSTLERRIRDIDDLNTEISSLNRRIQELQTQSAHGLPSEDDIANLKQKSEKYALAVRAANTEPRARMSPIKLVLLIIGILSLAAGAAMGIRAITAGYILAAVGACLAALSTAWIILAGKRARKEASEHAEALKNEIQQRLQQWLSPADIPDSPSAVNETISKLSIDIKKLSEIEAEINDKSRRAESVNMRLNSETEKLKDIFCRYGLVETDMHTAAVTLKQAVKKYSESESLKVQIAELRAEARQLLDKLQIPEQNALSPQTEALRNDRKDLEALTDRLAQDEREAKEYYAEKGLSERPASSDENDIESIEREYESQASRLKVIDGEIYNTEEQTSYLDSKTEELEQQCGKLSEYESSLKLYMDTIYELKAAQEALKQKYVGPVKKAFVKYAEQMEEQLGEKVEMDRDFSISFDRSGELRSDAYLSQGQKSLCSLCFRLAVIDNIYKQNKPFVIMDDPFVHLDEKHLKNVLDAVETLALGRQIIYFCCHPSRQIQTQSLSDRSDVLCGVV